MRRRRAAALAALAALTGCGGSPRVLVEQGSPGAGPVFRLSASDDGSGALRLATLQVHSCEAVVEARTTSWIAPRERAAWYIDWWPRDAEHPAPAPARVAYGRVPAGMQEDRPAEPLERSRGCYVVQAVSAGGAGGSKGARAGFRVSAGGSVAPLSAAEIDSLVRAPRSRR
jgi:hypothetical protein